MFGFSFKPRNKGKSAQTAKERLQILLAHERGGNGSSPDYLPMLQRDILEAIKKHVHVERDAVDIRMERDDELSSLEINIELPGGRTVQSSASS
ncbi:cell division topological specificity factor MinE [Tranquillimonas rosea]|uniref:Cell division topological specificity factor n=1 Tax=Tranquillimonas rosea TaxID=641238 RepID=A0A1H9PIT1_9RHOB|nr:cell division topological specificity factor MinE [Tranquillimonas rosea]SER47473.1 cell division topological specificity factor MinE [Tranquillimonas rosea]